MKLSYKLTLLFGGLSLLSIVIITTIAFHQGKKIIEKKTIDHLITTNNSKQELFEQWVQGNTHLLESIIKLPVLQTVFSTALNEHDQKNANHSAIHEQIRSHLVPFIKNLQFLELFLVNASNGNVVISTDPLQEGKYKDDQPFFINGRNQTYVQDIIYDVAAQIPAMMFSVPLIGSDGKTVALLAGKVNLVGLSQIIERRNQFIKTKDSYLVNKFNYFITEPRFGKGYALKKSVHTVGLEKARQEGKYVGLYPDYRNIMVLGACRWMPEWQLFLVTEIDQIEALAPIYRLKNIILGIASFLSIAAALAGWKLSFSLTRPLVALTKATQQIGDGKLDIELDTSKKGEIFDLAREFDAMRVKLKSTMVSKDKLEKQIVVRKKAEAKLKKAMEGLKQSNEDLQQFAYVASHDLQEPLRMVSSFTQLLAKKYKDELDEKAQRWIDFAVDGANRMQILIQDLLSFSRVNTHGKEFEPVDTQEIMESVLANLQIIIQETKAQVTVGKLPSIKADHSQMMLLLQNLVSNAIKFCKAGPPEIFISAEQINREWVFQVKDNGIGIDSQYLDRIFLIFQRLHTREEYPGTGLGLAVCKRIIQRHGGRLWVESVPGQGSVFYFSITA